jgi:curved DNA-binding protein CbpA
MADNKKYYEILGVPKTATRDEINFAFRKKAMECHPDRFTDEKDKEAAKAKFQMVNEAHDILSDESKRNAYDDEMPTYDSGSGSGYDFNFDYTNPFANMNTEFNFGKSPIQNPILVDLAQAMYSNSSSAPKTTDEILQRKRGGK